MFDRRKHSTAWNDIAVVRGAVIFDFAVHASLARAIQPVHAPADGDVLYAITTNEIDEKELNPTALGIVAAELLWDAVLSCFVA